LFIFDGTTSKLQTDHTSLTCISVVTMVTSFFIAEGTNIQAIGRPLKLNMYFVGDSRDFPDHA
jgi:hypothetical protein